VSSPVLNSFMSCCLYVSSSVLSLCFPDISFFEKSVQSFTCLLIRHGTVVLGSGEWVEEFSVAWIAFEQVQLSFFYSIFVEFDVSECFAFFSRVYVSGVIPNVLNCSVSNVEFLSEHVCKICLFSHFRCIG
jgi:hypothetical protein